MKLDGNESASFLRISNISFLLKLFPLTYCMVSVAWHQELPWCEIVVSTPASHEGSQSPFHP